MAQDLLFLEFQNEHLTMFDPCPKEFADFFSEFLERVFIVPFFFKFSKMLYKQNFQLFHNFLILYSKFSGKNADHFGVKINFLRQILFEILEIKWFFRGDLEKINIPENSTIFSINPKLFAVESWFFYQNDQHFFRIFWSNTHFNPSSTTKTYMSSCKVRLR